MVSLPGFENVKRDINTICLARSSGTCLAAVLHKGEKKWPDTARRHNKGQGGDARAETRSGKKATSRKQAIAIGLSKARKTGAKVPPKKGGSKKK